MTRWTLWAFGLALLGCLAVPVWGQGAQAGKAAKLRQVDQDLLDACEHRDPAKARKAIEQGANASVRDPKGFTPIWLAAMTSPEIAKLLLEHRADPNVVPDDEPHHGDMSLPNRMTPLMLCAYVGNLESAKLLLEHGAKTEMRDERGMTALMWAALSGGGFGAQLRGGGAGDPGSEAFTKLLLSHKADPNAADSEGQTALMAAAVFGRKAIVLTLLDAGAQVDARNKRGRTALGMAIEGTHMGRQAEKDLLAVVKALLDHGASTARHGESDPMLDAKISGVLGLEELLRTGKVPAEPGRVLPAPTRDLVASAKRIAKLPAEYRVIAWLGTSEVVCARPSSSTMSSKQWAVWNVNSHQERVVTNRQLPNAYSFSEEVASPDGRYILNEVSDEKQHAWVIVPTVSGKPVTRMGPKEGAAVGARHGGGTPCCAWLRTSAEWAALGWAVGDRDIHVLVYGVGQDTMVRSVRATPPRGDGKRDWFMRDKVVGVTASGMLLCTEFLGSHSLDQVEMLAIPLDAGKTQSRLLSVRLPVRSEVRRLVLSSKGDRILWVLQTLEDIEQWVSREDGSAMKPVARHRLNPEGVTVDGYGALWLPDGKHVSFTANELRGRNLSTYLYTIAVEP